QNALVAALRELGGDGAALIPTPAPAPTPAAAPAAPAPQAPAPEPVVVEKPQPAVAEPEPVVAAPAAPEPEPVKAAPPEPVKAAPKKAWPQPVGAPWIKDPTSGFQLQKEKWTGKVLEITLGATVEQGGTRTHALTIGGETTLPYQFYEGAMPHPPAIAIEIVDKKPTDWSPLLLKAWGDVMDDPAAWAKAAEAKGAEALLLRLSATQADSSPNTAANARATVRKVLQATGLPLIIYGPGQVELDNDLLVAVAEEAKGERVVLGLCEDKNYRTIVAAALANDQLVITSTAMDVNLAKQLNILVSDMGLPLDRILMDPTCAAIGYGMEYGYSVMERLRNAALTGDKMTQLPMIVTVGAETWRQKESRVGEGVPKAWGNWEERSINWETLTASALIESAANLLVLRHPETVRRVRAMIAQLMAARG
ncbi:MAG: acetyl-CoA decarbonylase/synthase complex subunit delta, partial [Anaerolineae bacterium]